MSAANPIYNETQALFLGLFGRPAAAPGLLSTASALAAHPNGTLGSLGSVAAADPSLYLNGDTSTSSQIELIFDRLTGREPLTPALTYMTDAVSSGTSSLGQIAALIYTNVSAEPSNYPFADLTVMNDKLTAANNFELQNPTYNSATYFAEGQTINTTITPISTAPAGQVIDITSTATNYVAAPGTGTVTFLDAGTSSGNIQPYDTINANGNVGTLEEYGSGTASSFFPTSMNGISTILLYDNNSSTLASPFNVSDIINTATSEPVANLIIDVSSTSTSTYYEVASTQSVTVENASSSTSSLYISESTSGATLNLTLENDSMSSTSVILYSSTSSQFSPTTINLESNGTAVNNIANLKVADNSTINISGSANLTISALDDASTSATSGITVDATQTGTLTLAVPTDLASTATFTFDGTGTGTDILNLTSAATSGVTYNLTGDSNSANTVNVDYLTSGSTLVDYVSAATGFSTLEFNSTSAAVTLDVAKISAGFTTFVDNASTSTSFTYNSVANNDTFSFTSLVSASTSAIINAAATGATVNVDLGHTHGGITLASLDLYNSTSAADSFSTINIDSYGSTSTGNVITTLKVADNSTINISGSANLTISALDDASTSATSGITVDATQTGTLTLAVPTDLASTATFTFDGTGTGTDILNLTSAATSGVTYNLTGDSNSANTVNVDYLTSGSTLVDYVSAATGFSTLEFNSTSAAVTLDVAKISAGFTTFVDNASTSTSFTYNSVANNDTFSFTSLVSASTSAIINAAATGATVNVDLGHTHGGITLASLDLYNSTSAADSFSTINLESNGTSANTNTITALYAADHSTINITGTEALTISSSIGIADASSTPYSGSVYSGITVDAQNFTGTLNLTLDSASTSNIATASDTVIFGTGGGTVDTNLGNDTINTTYDISSSHVAAVDNYAIYSATGDTIQPNNIITMTDTNSTVNYSNDTIYFAADSTSGLLTSTSSMGSNAEKSGYFNTAMYGFSATPSSSEQAISQVINTLQTDITPATSVASTFDAAAWFQYGGNTYVVNAYDVSTASTSAVAATNTFTDQIVKLTGNVDLSHADVKSGVINHL